MKKTIMIGICTAVGSLSFAASLEQPLRTQQNQLNDRQQMQQRELLQRQQSRAPEQPAQIHPVRSDIRQNPTPQERQQIHIENHQKELQHRQTQIAPQQQQPKHHPQPPPPQQPKHHPQPPPPPKRNMWNPLNWFF